MADISIIHVDGEEYVVAVHDDRGDSKHRVTVTDDDIAWLGVEASPREILEASFRFLLEREPKEAILSRFDLPVIARYFPEYRDEMRSRLGR